MQIQEGNNDCGLFAIASLFTLLSGDDPSKVKYDQSLMGHGQHFISSVGNYTCFSNITQTGYHVKCQHFLLEGSTA